MLQWINDRVKHFGWIILAPIILTFAVWGVHGLVDFSNKVDKGLRVNGEELPVERVRNAYQQQLAQLRGMLPEGEVPAPMLEGVRKSLVDRYVGATLLNQQVQKQRYVVTDQEVVQSIHQIPAFQVGGQFNRDAYEGLLRQQNLNPLTFEAEERQSLKSRQLEGGIVLSAFVTPNELERTIALQKESREVAYAVIPVAKYLAAANPDAAAQTAYYEAHKAEFMSPDTVALDYVELKLEDVSAGLAVTDEALRGYYDQVKDRYVVPERRRARHILISSGADDAKAKARAEELYQAALAPNADFAALAKANSADTVSAAEGGDLGWAERSYLEKPFAEALFAMQAGDVHAPVKTKFGWHVIKLEGVETGRQKSFEDVRPELEAEYRRNEAEKQFGERQERIDTLAFENGGSLEPVAHALGLSLKSVADYTRSAGGGALPAAPKLVAAAFSPDVLGGQNSRAIELKPGDVLVVRASNHRAPTQQPQDAVQARVLAGAKLELARTSARAAADALAQAVRSGTPFAQAIAPLGATRAADAPPPAAGAAPPTEVRLQSAKLLERNAAGVAPELLRAVFKAPTPAAGKAETGVVPVGGDVAVYALSAVKPGVADEAATHDLRPYSRAQGSSEVAAYIATLKAAADVRIDPKLFE